jgi:glycosyltransferase involved in cell wall biosynthesis
MPERHVHVVPNPVRDMRRFARNGPPAGCIVAVARLAPEKGLDILIRAFARIAGEISGWRLLIVGEGPERESLADLAETLGVAPRVQFRGWVAEPADVLANADLFVMSSRYEGFPNALLEAMACGLPVISTACAGPQEIITHEHDGILIPVNSVDALTATMRRLIQDEELRTRLGRNARAVSTRYSVDAIAQRWDAVLGARPAEPVILDDASARPR